MNGWAIFRRVEEMGLVELVPPNFWVRLLSHSFCSNSLADDLQCWLGFNLRLLTSSPTGDE